jgi:hypothetical protein
MTGIRDQRKSALVLDRGKELDWFGSGEIVTLTIVSAVRSHPPSG